MTKRRRINWTMVAVLITAIAGTLYPIWVNYINPVNIFADPEVGGALAIISVIYWVGVVAKLLPIEDD